MDISEQINEAEREQRDWENAIADAESTRAEWLLRFAEAFATGNGVSNAALIAAQGNLTINESTTEIVVSIPIKPREAFWIGSMGWTPDQLAPAFSRMLSQLYQTEKARAAKYIVPKKGQAVKMAVPREMMPEES